jgi:hypothetical protein
MLSESKIAAYGFCWLLVGIGATIIFLDYISSPEYLYKTTLKTVMNCRQTAKPQNPAEIDVICGKIPHISNYDY